MKIKEIQSGNATINDLKEVSLFLSDFWASLYPDGFRRLAVLRSDESDVIACFSVFSYKKLRKDMTISPPLSPYSGFSILTSQAKLYKKQSDVKRFLRVIAEYLEESFSGHYIDISLPPDIKDIQPFQQLDFNSEVSYTFLLDLRSQSPEALLSGMSTERRKNIKDGLKSELTVQTNPDPALVNALISRTLVKQGVDPHPHLLDGLLGSNSPEVFSLGVFQDNELLSTIIVAVDNKRAFYLAGGTIKDNHTAGPLVIWNAILQSLERGAEYFDFMGSSVPAIERYFRGFGGELTPYFRIRKNTVLIDALRSVKKRLK